VSSVSNVEEILAQIRSALVEIGIPNGSNAKLETAWSDLDVDSLDLVEIVRMLEDHYGLSVPDERLAEVETVGDAVNLVHELVVS